ncbi:MAG: beta-galactosidase, partial [Dactylosporangium sp.]|nr:Beta-galactosidase C-terminal domain [Dactylosporangium sp.]NNJ63044.1 beta-galactosidase [Dactylosporangium sp.]
AHTRHRHGEGTAHYLTTHPVGADLEAFLDRIARSAGVLPTLAGPVPGVDATTRRSADGVRWTFLANNGPDAVQVELTGQVLTGAERTPGGVLVPGGGFAVVRQEG